MKEFNFDDFEEYCRQNISHYDNRIDYAWEVIDRNRCPLSFADERLYREIEYCLEDYCEDNDIDIEELNIDEMF